MRRRRNSGRSWPTWICVWETPDTITTSALKPDPEGFVLYREISPGCEKSVRLIVNIRERSMVFRVTHVHLGKILLEVRTATLTKAVHEFNASTCEA